MSLLSIGIQPRPRLSSSCTSIFASCPRQRKRFRVKAGTAIRTVNAAAEYANVPGKLPEDTSITKGLIKAHDFIPLFVTDKAGGR